MLKVCLLQIISITRMVENNCLFYKFFLIAVLILPSLAIKACDGCGTFMGITPYDNQSSITLLHRYRYFGGQYGEKQSLFAANEPIFKFKSQTSSPIAEHHDSHREHEVFRTLEVRGRYFLSKRIEFNAILPYNANSENHNRSSNTVAGIGDINLFTAYHLIRKLDQKTINQRLIVGLGVKLPTGKINVTNDEGIPFGILTQPGTGSTDGFVYVNYLMGYKKAGLSLSSTYKVNGENKNQESIANSATSFLNVFYKININETYKLFPSAQFAYEYTAGEKYMGVKTGEHGINNLMGGFGVDLFIKNITLNMALQSKVWAAKENLPMPSSRLVLGLTYNFNQLYYLIN